MLGVAHDTWDGLADALHTGSASTVSLDELHDPNRVWALGSDNPAELRAEIDRLRAELGAYRAALSRPFPVAVLHWPEQELTELTDAYPSLAEEYPSHQQHLRHGDAQRVDVASRREQRQAVLGWCSKYRVDVGHSATGCGEHCTRRWPPDLHALCKVHVSNLRGAKRIRQ